ncbi:pumilio-like proteiny domain family member 6 [Emericellopsis cladophorae]|uniref:Pumilio-like proteiny domain family member 6 n=1 Tax=Emericellopsis cladophorae TaxID=2686198 RepID=A0A9P9XZ49_9HYPO|nr:pumilio-like proteiny domain family member 6 [Emericellopsis cladophorae]KAI6780168.1 pumilio-like proteiny domain family member 6 [Emericellopsis cladophorae]
MAAKAAGIDKKRKAPSAVKEKSSGKPKKPRAEESPADEMDLDEEDFEDFSGSEDGGAKLDERPAKKGKTSGSNGKSFEQDAGLTSRETHAKQKQLALERKAAKPLADEVQRTKKIWERLRIKSSVPKDERQKLVDELFTIITGRMRDFVLKHDAVRAVQTALKYSGSTQRKQIAMELQGAYAQLAESRYAKFLIGKLLVNNDDEIRDMIIPEFYGRVRKMINHPEASWILDDIYRTVATKEQKARLLREWYGPEFVIKEMANDTEVTADLKKILEAEPSKRGHITKSLFDMINTLVQKKMTGFTMLHDAMLQYFLNSTPGTEEFNEFSEIVKGDESGDLLKNLAFTKSGTRLTCLLLAYGSAKDRKHLLKAFKDTFQMMAGDQYAHLVILTAFDVIDDTKLTSKSIFPEILGEGGDAQVQNVLEAVHNPFARSTILYLLEGMSKSLFPAGQAYDVEVLNEVHEIRKTTSKKDPEARRQELVAAFSPQLISAVAATPRELTSSTFGCQLVADVMLSCEGDKSSALDAIAQCAEGAPTAVVEGADDVAPPVHISQTAFGSRMLKSLIQGGRFDKAAGKVILVEPPLNFSDTLYAVIKDHVLDWATGPGSFVIVGLVEANDFSDKEALRKVLKKNKSILEKAATEATAEQKAAKESEKKEAKSKSNKKGAKKGEKPVGNMGSKILLKAL